MDLAARLSLHAGTRPDATALIEADSGRSWSWAELDGRITASTVALRRAGLVPGARVLVGVEHRLETVAWLLACWRCGGVVVPVSPGLPPRERAFFTEHSGAGLSVSAAGAEPQATGVDPGLPSPRGDEGRATAAILYTSGSTGDPKGVELSHGALIESATRVGRRYAMGPGTRFLSVLPLFHGHGLVVTLLAPLLAGGAVILDGPFDAFSASRFWRSVDEHGATIFSSVPAILRVLVALCPPREAVPGRPRFGLCASAPLSPALRAAVLERFGCPVGNSYGLTETAAWCAYGDPEPEHHRVGAVGRPIAGTVRILRPVDGVGEIQVRSPCVMSGYFRNPEATAGAFEDGWLRTGDLGRIDADGHLFLVGRRRDVINHGGFSVYPGEVDGVLEAHPAVREAATVERPSPTHGEVPVAFVALERPVEPSALREHCRGQLAPHKVPVEIVVLDALPRSPTRKVRKDQLRSLARDGVR